jgi:hypothetical protein
VLLATAVLAGALVALRAIPDELTVEARAVIGRLRRA